MLLAELRPSESVHCFIIQQETGDVEVARGTKRLLLLTAALLCGAWSSGGWGGFVGFHGRATFHAPVRAPVAVPGVMLANCFGRIGHPGRSHLNGRFAPNQANLIWPYWPLPGPYLAPPPAAPAGPETIVIARALPTNPAPATPQPLPSLTYVAGCHAIPNGYHCDPPQ